MWGERLEDEIDTVVMGEQEYARQWKSELGYLLTEFEMLCAKGHLSFALCIVVHTFLQARMLACAEPQDFQSEECYCIENGTVSSTPQIHT